MQMRDQQHQKRKSRLRRFAVKVLFFGIFWYAAETFSYSFAEDFNILIVGNSFTQTNGNLNEYLDAMLGSDSSFAGNYSSINFLKTSVNGQTLSNHATSGSATYQAITSSVPYDCIILQEYSTGTQTTNLSASQNINNMTKGGRSLYQTIQNSASRDAQLLLFETWERTGTIPLETIQSGYRVLASTINTMSQAASHTHAATIVDVGSSWMDVKNLTDLNLYSEDNDHQNRLGTYLNALKFYQQITGETNVVGTYERLKNDSRYTAISSTLTEAEANSLEQVASRTLDYPDSQQATYTGTHNLGLHTFQGHSTLGTPYFVNASGSDTELTTRTFNVSYDAVLTLQNGARMTSTDSGFNFV